MSQTGVGLFALSKAIKLLGDNMRKLILLGVVVLLLLLVLGAVWLSIPTGLTGWQRYAFIFLGILTGLAAIAEIIGLINYFKEPNTKKSIEIKTKGKFSPAQVKGDVRINPAVQSKKTPQPSTSSPTQTDELKEMDIQTEGDYSPGIVEGDYEANDGK